MATRKPGLISIVVAKMVKLPSLPNFIRYGDSEQSMDVSELSDAHLKAIGREWTKALLAHAAKRRAEKGQ